MSLASSTKRIAKNTLLLYIRMLVMMAITLYTSRIVLHLLGVEDFGIYNLVGGIVVMFSFLNSAMAVSTQRFLNYEIGKGGECNVQKILSTSLIIHFFLILLIILLAETIGLWFLNVKLNIPAERLTAANWVYQFSVFTFCINILRVPYQAAIIAYERMAFYAYLSIVEVILQLSIVYILVVSEFDQLIIYAGLLFVVAWIIYFISYFFCRFKFTTIRFQFTWEKSSLKKITSFSGWSLLGSLANVGAQQGINMLLNIFYGVAINASVGIANQVSSAIYRFISNFSVAYQPQIVQLYAAEKRYELINLVFKSSKFSYFLFLILSVPVFAYCEPILQFWLGTVPEYSAGFCRLIILYLLFDAASAPLWISVQATGKIRNYQIFMSILILLNLPFSYLCLRAGLSPYSVWLIRFLLNIIAYLFRFVYLKRVMDFSPVDYLKKVVFVIFIVTFLVIPIPWCLVYITDKPWGIILGIIVSLFSTVSIVYFIGLTKSETDFVKVLVRKLLKR